MYYQLNWRADDGEDYSNTADSPKTRVPWTMGVMYRREVPQPLICNLNPKRGPKLRDLYLIDIPLFSNRFVKLLEDNGVSNLQCFNGGVREPDGTLHDNYKAVNIVGLIACADLEKSEYISGSEPPIMEFTKLVIDEAKIGEHEFFRVQENSLYILVSESLKNVIEQSDLKGFSLTPIESS
ncbi:MAG: hypothetical protein JXR90_15420 [Spirochaetes bacterium]|nr:hypothetical protein [Bacteroidales bacterium]MBN2772080.1 hypothetical protein [Spirochaetota bacterium]